jgi:hypothetical protein
MRIISNFRDYYDGVQGQGFDDRIIYERRTVETDIRAGAHVGDLGPVWEREPGWGDTRQPADDLALLPDFYAFRPQLHRRGERYPDHRAAPTPGLLCLAGRAYPIWQTQAIRVLGEESLYSYEPGFADRVGQTERRRAWRPETIDFTPWQDWLAAHWGREIDPAIHFRHDSPVVLFLGERRVVDPCLKDLGFQKALDPYTVFQEIDMFLGGVMAQPRDPPSPMSDREKISSHGMDVKRSFRKMPRD